MQGTDEVIDEIDTLIGEQLAAGEPMNGYDFDDPDFPTCWHCGRDWHGLAVTERMNQMRARGEFEEGYRYADDDSAIICPGSAFIGPVQTPPRTARLGFSIIAPDHSDHVHLDPGRYVGLFQQSESFAYALTDAWRGFVEHMNQLTQVIWAEIPNWSYHLGEWIEPPADPVAAALPDVRDLATEGWQPVGYLPEGFVFEVDEPQLDDAAATALRDRIEACACELSSQETEAPLSLPVNPTRRRQSSPPFWVARTDGRR
ncbi:hypothetical protein BOWSER_64 [Gordonia phage Bowser]|uniref:Uncharacterized protein n=1 Tax=Gordonia phage Bowser TaxID=1838063 RepID=A0A160DCT6_9CAUD|nr:hypothetical protein BH770_gp64 [Gordonia phage Bowser]ANA85459.1 hypothetical protein BOWSER_64 [Gordonia phage Bowser]